MGKRIFFCSLLALLGVSFFIFYFYWKTPNQAFTKESQKKITSLLKELRDLNKTISQPEMKTIKDSLEKAKKLNISAQKQLIRLRRSSGRRPASFTYRSRHIKKYISKTNSYIYKSRFLINAAQRDLGVATRGLIDVNRRITDIDGRIQVELRTIKDRIGTINEPIKLLTKVWLPSLVSLASIAVGIFSIWLGWRKDRREMAGLRQTSAPQDKV